jgi:integrase
MGEDGVRTRTLSDGELLAVWRGLRQTAGLEIRRDGRIEKVFIGRAVRIALEVAMYTLQRRAEISGMRRSELDLERGTWIIGAARTKGRAEHLAPLSEPVVQLIREALALQDRRGKGDSDFVFPSPHSNAAAIGPGALSHAMADLTAALGLEDASLHDLRRTGATGMAALGVPPFIVSKVLAHKDAGGGAAVTARHYNLYVYEAEKRDALNRWAERLDALFGPRSGKTGQDGVCDGIGP